MATTTITAEQGFDETYYLQAKAAQLTASTGTTWSVAQTLAAIEAAGLTPAEHYSQYGYNEGLAPNGYFNSDQYAASKAAAAGISVAQFEIAWYQASGSTNLYLHYLQYGAFEDNVNPSTGFNDQSYYTAKAAEMGAGTTWQDARDAIQAAGMTAISHYLLYGINENLAYTPTSSGAVGETFTLTTATDIINGTTANDTIIGDWGATTVNASDQINGGAGTDTLKVYGALGALPATVSNVEIVELVNPGTNTITDTTLGLPAGVTTLKIDQVSAATGTITTTSTSGLTLDLATLNGAGASAVTWAANATDTSLSLELSGYQGATAAVAANLDVTGAAATTMNIATDTAANKIATFTLPTTVTSINVGANTNLTVSGGLVSTAAKTVTVSGEGKVTFAGATNLAATVTVDATNNTGGVLYTDEAAGSTLTFKGGSGNDAVTFAAGKLTTADTLSGGAGTDTLIVNDTVLNTKAGLTAVNAATEFEILGLATTGASLDLGLVTNGINGVAVGAGNISATTTNSLSTTTYTIDNSAGNTGTVSIGNKTGQYDTSVTIDYGTAAAAQTLANLTLSGATTVSLVSTGTGTGGSNTITTLANTDNSTITITGSKDLTITNDLAGTKAGSIVDAHAFTGKLTVSGTGFDDTITGGSKNDTLNGAAGKDTIYGMAGNDTITVDDATQADVLAGGDGADTFKFSGTSATVYTTSNGTSDIVSITDFVAGTDKISLNDTTANFTAATVTTQTIATADDLSAIWAGITPAAASASGGNVTAVVLNVAAGTAAGTYLYVNDTTAAVNSATDMLVNITGISGSLTASDITFA